MTLVQNRNRWQSLVLVFFFVAFFLINSKNILSNIIYREWMDGPHP